MIYSVGDTVRTRSSLVYTVRHAGPTGTLSLEPLRPYGDDGRARHATRADAGAVVLIRSAELHAFDRAIRRARVRRKDGREVSALYDYAGLWLNRAGVRNVDRPNALGYAALVLAMNRTTPMISRTEYEA